MKVPEYLNIDDRNVYETLKFGIHRINTEEHAILDRIKFGHYSKKDIKKRSQLLREREEFRKALEELLSKYKIND